MKLTFKNWSMQCPDRKLPFIVSPLRLISATRATSISASRSVRCPAMSRKLPPPHLTETPQKRLQLKLASISQSSTCPWSGTSWRWPSWLQWLWSCLSQVPAIRNVKYYTCCDEPYLDITFNITMRRKTLFYTVRWSASSQFPTLKSAPGEPDHPLHGHLLPHHPRLLPSLRQRGEGDQCSSKFHPFLNTFTFALTFSA